MMKNIFKSTVWAQLLLVGCAFLTSCGEDTLTDLIMGGQKLPAGATPAEEFKPGNAAPEAQASHAALFTIDDAQCPYESVEFFGDGNFLLMPRGYYYQLPPQQAPAKLTRRADGSVAVQALNLRRSPATRDGEPTCQSGTYTVSPEGNYVLTYTDDNGTAQEAGLNLNENDTYQLTYPDGNRVSTVYCDKQPAPAQQSAATSNFCRTWKTLYWDFWLVYKKKARLHVNYNAETELYSGDYDDDDYADDEEGFDFEDEDSGMMAYKVTFSPNGTYVCYFRNNNNPCTDYVDVRKWSWEDPAQGTIHWNADNGDESGMSRGFATVRFAGDMMRIYEQYSDNQSGLSCDMYIVNTFSAL